MDSPAEERYNVQEKKEGRWQAKCREEQHSTEADPNHGDQFPLKRVNKMNSLKWR